MSTRRTFLWSSVGAATAMPALARGSLSAGIGPWAGAVDAVLFDQRYADSRAFAQALTRYGAIALAVQDDTGRLWHERLAPLFARGGARLAGMTLHSDLFISTEFARQYRAAPKYQGIHDCRGSSTLTHTIDRPALVTGWETALAGGEAHWAGALGRRIAMHFGNIVTASGGPRVAYTPRTPDHPGVLYSWVIG